MISIDRESMRVWQDGREVRLTPLQYSLLAVLASTPGQVVTRQQLAKRVWGYDDVATCDKTLSMHMVHLRKALGGPRVIETVRGVGYRLPAESLAAGPLTETAARLHALASAEADGDPAEVAAALRDAAATLTTRAEALEAKAGSRQDT